MAKVTSSIGAENTYPFSKATSDEDAEEITSISYLKWACKRQTSRNSYLGQKAGDERHWLCKERSGQLWSRQSGAARGIRAERQSPCLNDCRAWKPFKQLFGI